MQRWRGSSVDVAVDIAVGLAFGLMSERAVFEPTDLTNWIPDLVTGMVWIACGALLLTRTRGVAWLMIATGLAWFAANVWSEVLFLHRGLIIHVLLAYPRLRPRTRLGLTTVVLGYVSTVDLRIWQHDGVAIALGVAVVIGSAHEWRSARGSQRRVSSRALMATATFAAVVAAQSVARLGFDVDSTSTALSLTYQLALWLAAVVLARSLPPGNATQMADLVVELGQSRSGTLRDALASSLGDPTLQVGYLEEGEYVDLEGRAISLPTDSSTTATYVSREAQPFAVLVHDSHVLAQPALVESVATATRLTNANSDLQRDVRDQMCALTVSRRRLLTAADQARRELDDRLRAGAEQSLHQLDDRLVAVTSSGSKRVARARELLALTLDDLRQLTMGLHPRVLDDGLTAAIETLVVGMPLDVQLAIHDEPSDVDTRTAVFFVCAEAVANSVKHANARSVSIELHVANGAVHLSISDDGSGGASVAAGTGLRGLIDRVESLEGTVRIVSPAGAGTRIVASIPAIEAGH